MTMNLVVPLRQVRFVFCLDESAVFRVEEISVVRYARTTLPPGIWFRFQDIAAPQSLMLNVASIPQI